MNQPRLTFCGNPVSSEDLELILEIVNDYGLPRLELAATVCELLDWRRPSGKLKEIESLQFLESLETRGLLSLPAPKNKGGGGRHRAPGRTQAGVEGQPLTVLLNELDGLRLTLVETVEQRSLWKELIDRYHYLGFKQPFGAHLRYLVEIDGPRKSVIGCLQFSSPAWRIQGRDSWIGWNEAARKRHLQKVVQNSRFLLLPWVAVKGLASHILSRASKRLPDDWSARFNVRPLLLETFVDSGRYKGTCYKAANWLLVGETSGRGRMDRTREADEPVKTVWMYPLHRNFRRYLEGGTWSK